MQRNIYNSCLGTYLHEYARLISHGLWMLCYVMSTWLMYVLWLCKHFWKIHSHTPYLPSTSSVAAAIGDVFRKI
jgi:hypothetical protein